MPVQSCCCSRCKLTCTDIAAYEFQFSGVTSLGEFVNESGTGYDITQAAMNGKMFWLNSAIPEGMVSELYDFDTLITVRRQTTWEPPGYYRSMVLPIVLYAYVGRKQGDSVNTLRFCVTARVHSALLFSGWSTPYTLTEYYEILAENKKITIQNELIEGQNSVAYVGGSVTIGFIANRLLQEKGLNPGRCGDRATTGTTLNKGTREIYYFMGGPYSYAGSNKASIGVKIVCKDRRWRAMRHAVPHEGGVGYPQVTGSTANVDSYLWWADFAAAGRVSLSRESGNTDADIDITVSGNTPVVVSVNNVYFASRFP